MKAKAFARSEVVNAGVACVSDDGRRVGVLVVVDATTGNVKQSDDLTISFTATMEEVDGEWLVANLDGWDPSALAGGGESRRGVRQRRAPSPSDGSSEAAPGHRLGRGRRRLRCGRTAPRVSSGLPGAGA